MKKILLIVVLVLMLGLTSCSLSHIEDTNGENNYELNTLKNEEIFTYNSYIEVGSVDEEKSNSFNYKCKKLTGNKLIKTLSPKGRTLNISVICAIFSGNAYVALIRDDKIYQEIDPHRVQNFIIDGESDVELRILAESCNFSIAVNIEVE